MSGTDAAAKQSRARLGPGVQFETAWYLHEHVLPQSGGQAGHGPAGQGRPRLCVWGVRSERVEEQQQRVLRHRRVLRVPGPNPSPACLCTHTSIARVLPSLVEHAQSARTPGWSDSAAARSA
eukprot:3864375-Rhodomonas_salina.1